MRCGDVVDVTQDNDTTYGKGPCLRKRRQDRGRSRENEAGNLYKSVCSIKLNRGTSYDTFPTLPGDCLDYSPSFS